MLPMPSPRAALSNRRWYCQHLPHLPSQPTTSQAVSLDAAHTMWDSTTHGGQGNPEQQVKLAQVWAGGRGTWRCRSAAPMVLFGTVGIARQNRRGRSMGWGLVERRFSLRNRRNLVELGAWGSAWTLRRPQVRFVHDTCQHLAVTHELARAKLLQFSTSQFSLGFDAVQ